MTTLQLPRIAPFADTTNPALLTALASLPAYDEQGAGQTRLATALQKASGQLLEAAQARVALVQAVTDSARADKPIATGVAKQAAETDARLTETRALVALLQEADRTLTAERDTALSAAPPLLLQHLDGQLAETLAAARALDLGDVESAQAAIDAGKADVWPVYTKSVDIARLIRDAQAQVVVHLVQDQKYTQQLDAIAAVRNYAQVFPTWLAHQRGTSVGTHNGEPIVISPPWGEDSDELFAYAVRHPDVQLWVPTVKQFHDAYSAAVTEARQLENARAREDDGLSLTPDQRNQLARQRLLERQYLTAAGELHPYLTQGAL